MQVLLTATIICYVCISLSYAGSADRDRKIPDYLREPLRDLHKECVTESGVSEDHLKVCLDRHVPDIQEVKCYIDCLLRRTMMYDTEGKVDFKKVRYMVPSDVWEILQHLQNECGHIHEPDGCETAYKATKCYFDSHEDVIEFCHLLVFDYQID